MDIPVLLGRKMTFLLYTSNLFMKLIQRLKVKANL